jgi:hAT family C-terminal dimerisation region
MYLYFWRNYGVNFPNLAKLCREVLAVPAASQQNLFKYTSDGNNMLKEQCERLKSENMTKFLAMILGPWRANKIELKNILNCISFLLFIPMNSPIYALQTAEIIINFQ